MREGSVYKHLVFKQVIVDAVLHDPELVILRRLFIVSQYRDPEIGCRLRHYWIEQPIAFQVEIFAGLICVCEFRSGLDPQAAALAFFGLFLALLQFAESGGDAEERARAWLRAHVRHFGATHRRQMPEAAVLDQLTGTLDEATKP